jgi:hypothetical protein
MGKDKKMRGENKEEAAFRHSGEEDTSSCRVGL